MILEKGKGNRRRYIFLKMKKIVKKASPRDVSPFFQWLRERMIGRKYEPGTHLRFEPDISDRTQPDPKLPDGVAHKLSGNYYFLRDPRRVVNRPLEIAGPEEYRKLPAGESREKYISLHKAGVVPGKLYQPSAEPCMPVINPEKLEKKK